MVFSELWLDLGTLKSGDGKAEDNEFLAFLRRTK